jgi:hypothetical protein
MGVYCFFLPTRRVASSRGGRAVRSGLSMLKIRTVILLILAFVVSTQLQFYLLGTARYL